MNEKSNSAKSDTEKVESRFICFLSNVTDNITKIDFGPNRTVRRISREEIVWTIESSEDLPASEIEWQIDQDMHLCNYRKSYGYVVEEQKVWERNKNDKYSYWDDPFNWFYRDINEKVDSLRLIKEGDLHAYMMIHQRKNPLTGEWESHGSNRMLGHVGTALFKIRLSEIEFLNTYLIVSRQQTTKKYMNLAYRNFTASYHLDDPKLVFITLMMTLEILFNKSTTELRYRVSRNVAVLLGKTKNKSEQIAKDLRGLYDIRSKIVHTGECDDLDKEKIILLRNYVRKCLLKLFALGIEKDELVALLNELGFGDFSPKLLSIKHKKLFNRIKYSRYL